MTHQEIEQILIGHELDAVITALMEPQPEPITARVLRERSRMEAWYSCHYAYSPCGWWRAQIGTDHNYDEDGNVRIERDDAPVIWETAKEPSADIEAAFEVVEKLQSIDVCLEVRPYSCPSKGFRVGVWMGRELDYATADTAPHAICRAALLWLLLSS